MVDDTKVYMQVYSGNQALRDAAEGLYIALLDAVQDMIAWLDEDAYSKSTYAHKACRYSSNQRKRCRCSSSKRITASHWKKR